MANFEVDTDTDSEPDSDTCDPATFNRVNTPQIETVF
ncbi:hypothetical protein D3OALGA1CA_876 [Olavius algarvensis associated proteobacterium Delta 3]|nr:hypothetical protein D3OALGA1CA_876 [Olavius algarvensis associated proteobacterium Delta 3]CAB5143540.1 hypothetical protein D3OALGB2SA_4379 [Olavius algarvensis associated proteobacterium Delta 3]